MRIGIEEIKDISRGAAILGCGGGGDPEIGRLMAEEAILVGPSNCWTRPMLPMTHLSWPLP